MVICFELPYFNTEASIFFDYCASRGFWFENRGVVQGRPVRALGDA